MSVVAYIAIGSLFETYFTNQETEAVQGNDRAARTEEMNNGVRKAVARAFQNSEAALALTRICVTGGLQSIGGLLPLRFFVLRMAGAFLPLGTAILNVLKVRSGYSIFTLRNLDALASIAAKVASLYAFTFITFANPVNRYLTGTLLVLIHSLAVWSLIENHKARANRAAAQA